MIHETFSDLTSLWKGMTQRLLLDPTVWDDGRPPRLLSHANMAIAETSHLEADLSWVGFTASRWTRFLNRYIDLKNYWEWIEKIRPPTHGATSRLLRTKEGEGHTGGECLIAMTYRPEPPTLTLYSREVEFPQRGLLDATLAHLTAEAISQGNFDVRIVWLIGGAQISLLHSIPYLVTFDLLDETLASGTKASKYLGYMTDHLETHRGKLKYGPAKRTLKRWDRIKAGEMPSVPISQLLIPQGTDWASTARKGAESKKEKRVRRSKAQVLEPPGLL